MSAIFGIFYRDGRPVDPADVERMQAILAHRGPDGTDTWVRGSVGLGHRMLHTTPESLYEHQPLVSRDGALVLTADARIDNRDELISALDVRDRPAGLVTDADLILAAYNRWGERCPEHLLGDFAFAIWNERQQTLFCARDHMGVKPLYYHVTPTLFAFTTEIKGLRVLSQVPQQVSELKIAQYLTGFIEDPEVTFFHKIIRLPAAHTVMVSRDHLNSRCYWSLNPNIELKLPSDRDYIELFRETFRNAVSRRLRSAFPVGSSLSGGLDSSSIACTARDILVQTSRPPLNSFSAIFPSLPKEDLQLIDERRYIDAVVAMGNINPHYIHADQISPLYDIERMVWYGDSLMLGINLYLHWAMYVQSKQQNIRIFLDGTDGDTTVSHGYEYLVELALTGQWFRFLKESQHLQRRLPRRRLLRHLVRLYAVEPYAAEASDWIRRLFNRRREYVFPQWSFIRSDFARNIGLTERVNAVLPADNVRFSARQQHHRDLSSAMIPSALEGNDWATGAFQIEPRYPFCDRELVEICLALPPTLKFGHGWPRRVLREAMTGVLPSKVQYRLGKGNLSPGFARGLMTSDWPVVKSIIERTRHMLSNYVDLRKIEASLSRIELQPSRKHKTILGVYTVAILGLGLESAGNPMPDYTQSVLT